MTMQKLKTSEQSFPISHQPDNVSSMVDSPSRPSSGDSQTLLSDADLSWLMSLSQRSNQADTLKDLLGAIVMDVRHHFQADRVLVYQLQPETEGTVVAESLAEGYTPSLNETLPAIAFGAKSLQDAQQQISIDDVAQAPLTPYQQQILARFQTQASLSMPILLDQAWGLLVVQQCELPRCWQIKESTLLYNVATELRLGLQSLELHREKLKAEQYEQALPDIIHKISDASYVESACQIAVQDVRQLLDVERIAIYKFRPDYFGDFVYESEPGAWPPLVGSAWEDTYLQDNKGGRFRTSEPFVADDIYTAGLSDCHVDTLEYFGVKSFAIVAIKQGEKLWGLLSAFQHSGPRHWLGRDITALAEVGRQLGATLQSADYLRQMQEQSAQMAQAARVSYSVSEIIPEILQAQDLDAIVQTANQSIRRLLKCDRVAIYRFHADWNSGLVAERATTGLEPMGNTATGAVWPRIDLQATQGGPYNDRKDLAVNNIHAAGFSAEQIEGLIDLEIQALIIAPIFKGNELWGLLGAYQSHEPRSWATVEIGAISQIATQVGVAMQKVDYMQQVERTSNQMAQSAEQERLITNIVGRIRQSLDVQQAFNTTTREIRSFLEADRVAVFRFDPGSGYSQGRTIAEDVRPGYVSALKVKVEDHCFSRGFAEKYRKGHVSTINNVYASGIQQCYIDVLAQFQVQANLVVPLLQSDDLWGLFCIHQCEHPRDWQESEINFAKRIAAQLDVAIQQGSYVQKLQQQSRELAQAVAQNRAAKEQIQKQVIQLLSAVRPALDGDLTVRAPVTESEVGTVADAYNNTLGSLQRLVIQMQEAASLVTHTSQASGSAITTLADQAQGQFKVLATALGELQVMAQTTQAVEVNAQQVEIAVQQANQTVLTGDAAIDRTVDEMQQIRGTVAETNKRLKRLGESSQKISKVVNLIGNFTTQTQLLALNASIEATRAGEYGRGFAVVADEVRSIARQSANAATDIEQLVQEIQASTAAVATAMEDGIQRVASGTTVVNEARESLKAIVTATEQISRLVFGITEATRNQTQQCQSVTQTMQDVAEIANQTSEDSVSISTAFQTLLKTAQDLEMTSQRFRVN
ncbi:MAG: GAF domain-containing protein [Elainellaceae cyanobacterium]